MNDWSEIIEGLKNAFYILEANRSSNEENAKFIRNTELAIEKALAIVEKQPPRLLTPEDFENTPDVDSEGYLPAWYENQKYPYMDGWNCIPKEALEELEGRERYWTSRPDDKRRYETPWE